MKTCDCFFDVGLFAKVSQLKCEEFHKLCICNQTKSFFFYYNVNQKLYIICCRNFIKDRFQTIGIEKLAKILRIDYMYWFDENNSD